MAKTMVYVFTFTAILSCIQGCSANQPWNVDQNRLEMESGIPKPQYRPQMRTEKYTNQYKRSHGYKTTGDSEEISYSHYTPRFVTASKKQSTSTKNDLGPRLYKPLEDPSVFYRNKVFQNMTENEKRLRQGIPRHIFPNAIEDHHPKITNNRKGLSIKLRGATVNVRSSDSVSYLNKNTKDSMNYDLPYSDAATKTRNFVGSTCMKCPAERTVIAGRGLNKVVLMKPQLLGCGGSKPPTGAEFKSLYGPRIGDLLNEGSHIIVGEISVNNKTQQLCQYRYNVVVQRCQGLTLPSGVEARCPKGNLWGAVCHLSCTNKEHKLKGNNMIYCKDNMEWSAPPPRCEDHKRNWCSMKHISKHGKITCDTPKVGEVVPEFGVPEGSVCSVLCYGGQKMEAPKIITCKSGKWQGRPVCKKSRRRRHKVSRTHAQSNH